MTIDFNAFQNNNTIAGQTTSSFSTGIKNLSQSVSSGISGALSGISSKLGLSGLSSGGSLSGAFNTVGSTNVVAELKDNLGVAQPIGATLPNDVPNKSAPPDTLTFPKDVGKYFMQLTFFDKFQDSPIARLKKNNTLVVILPIPQNLQESFGMEYSDQKLGMLGILEATGVLDENGLSAIMNATPEQAGRLSNGIGQNFGNIVTSGGGGSATLAAVRIGSKALGVDSVSNLLDRATGTILNPYQQLQFQGVNLRKHTFSYKFSPNSEAEAETLKEIIRQLKIRMHPTLNGLLMNFPDQCKIQLSSGMNDKAYYTFQDCYLESMTVNYAPEGTPAFSKQGKHPTQIQVDLNFGEIKPLTRNYYTGETDGINREAKIDINTLLKEPPANTAS